VGVADDGQDEGASSTRAKEPVMTAATSRDQTQELASRESDGLSVVLFWHPRNDAVTVSVADSRTGECFQLAVERDRALDAFYHPYAYAA
jgi:hypothetical protein